MDLTNEQQGILANILAQLKEIMQMQAGEEETTPEDVEMAEETEDYEIEKQENEKENEKENEEEVEKSDEGTHGDDKAEDRVEDLPKETKENVDEVSKAIITLAKMAQGKIQKKKPSKTDTVLKAIEDLIKVNKGLVVENLEQRNVLNEILEGLGISNQITKSLNGTTIKKSKPNIIDNSDKTAMLEHLRKELGLEKKEEKENYNGNSGKARGLIAKAMPGIFRKDLV